MAFAINQKWFPKSQSCQSGPRTTSFPCAFAQRARPCGARIGQQPAHFFCCYLGAAESSTSLVKLILCFPRHNGTPRTSSTREIFRTIQIFFLKMTAAAKSWRTNKKLVARQVVSTYVCVLVIVIWSNEWDISKPQQLLLLLRTWAAVGH